MKKDMILDLIIYYEVKDIIQSSNTCYLQIQLLYRISSYLQLLQCLLILSVKLYN